MPKTILVTGGAGFIGSHLCEKLLADGFEVVCLDNFFTGSKENIRHLLASDRFELLRHDVNDPLLIEVDAIFHLACPASPVQYQFDPVMTVRTNVVGTLNMLEVARRLKVPIIFSSTSEVYGDPEVHPQHEGYVGHVNPLGPRACYDEGKRCAETLCMDFHRQYGVDVRIARIFNTYGPRMAENDGRVVSNFIVQALRGQPITIYGDGAQTRSFQYVSDLVDGLLALYRAPSMAGPVNIGNPLECTIRELAEQIVRLSSSASTIVQAPLPADDPRRRRPDINLATTRLGWSPHIGLDEGLTKTISYFRNKLGISAASPTLHPIRPYYGDIRYHAA